MRPCLHPANCLLCAIGMPTRQFYHLAMRDADHNYAPMMMELTPSLREQLTGIFDDRGVLANTEIIFTRDKARWEELSEEVRKKKLNWVVILLET